MKRALVLSGGGAKGAFQYGALRYIAENEFNGMLPSSYFNIISGVSVGSLNGVMMAQDNFDKLSDLWNHITQDNIYKGNLGLLHIFWRLISHRLSVMSNEPLHEMIKRNISLDSVLKSNCDFMFGTVSVDTGLYYSFHAHDFDSEVQFQNGILASTAMPVIWPPVNKLTTKSGLNYTQLVDGGVRNISPLGDVIDFDPDEVVVINCNSEDFQPYPDPAKNMLKIAIRVLTEITLNEIFRQDIREFLHINRILKQLPPGTSLKRPDGTLYKHYECILIEPDHDLGDALDFNREKLDRLIQEGYETARAAYARYRESDNIRLG